MVLSIAESASSFGRSNNNARISGIGRIGRGCDDCFDGSTLTCTEQILCRLRGKGRKGNLTNSCLTCTLYHECFGNDDQIGRAHV